MQEIDNGSKEYLLKSLRVYTKLQSKTPLEEQAPSIKCQMTPGLKTETKSTKIWARNKACLINEIINIGSIYELPFLAYNLLKRFLVLVTTSWKRTCN